MGKKAKAQRAAFKAAVKVRGDLLNAINTCQSAVDLDNLLAKRSSYAMSADFPETGLPYLNDLDRQITDGAQRKNALFAEQQRVNAAQVMEFLSLIEALKDSLNIGVTADEFIGVYTTYRENREQGKFDIPEQLKFTEEQLLQHNILSNQIENTIAFNLEQFGYEVGCYYVKYYIESAKKCTTRNELIQVQINAQMDMLIAVSDKFNAMQNSSLEVLNNKLNQAIKDKKLELPTDEERNRKEGLSLVLKQLAAIKNIEKNMELNHQKLLRLRSMFMTKSMSYLINTLKMVN